MPPAARVVLAGERADVLDILPAFDVFALPSRYEGLPTAVVEAMLCGIPVVATAVNAVSDVVVPGETGLLVPPRRPDLLADAVRYLLDRPAVGARMADAARARLGDRFGEQALRDTLMAAYVLLPGVRVISACTGRTCPRGPPAPPTALSGWWWCQGSAARWRGGAAPRGPRQRAGPAGARWCPGCTRPGRSLGTRRPRG